MSSKKYDISKNIAIRICELMEYFSFNKRRQGKFAKLIGISPSYLSEVINFKSGPSYGLLFGIAKEFPGINLNWLLTGDGEIIREDEKGSLYNKVEDEDPEVAELVNLTKEVLKSGTDYSSSLTANIRSFHRAIRTERLMNGIVSRVGALEAERKISNQIRKDDPPKEKESFLKKRVM